MADGECSSSQLTPLLTSTGVGTLWIEKENHELIFQPCTHLFSCELAVVLACGQVELNNSLFRGMDRLYKYSVGPQ